MTKNISCGYTIKLKIKTGKIIVTLMFSIHVRHLMNFNSYETEIDLVLLYITVSILGYYLKSIK